MIAAGSLFTSCVTNTEPQGVKDLREAKADYLESLARLRDADAALVKAKAAYQDAQTALENANLQLKEITIAVEKAMGDAAIAKAKQDAELAAVEAQRNLAWAQYRLQDALDSIAVVSKQLNGEESKAVSDYTDAYTKYLNKLEKVRQAEAAVYNATEDWEAYIDTVKRDSAKMLSQIAIFEEFLKNLPDSGASVEEAKAFYNEQFQKKLNLEYAKANLDQEWNLYQSTNVNDAIKGFASGLVDWIAQNVALPAPFVMNYKAQLPDNEQVCKLLEKYLGKSVRTTFANGVSSFVPGFNGLEVTQDIDGKWWLTANFVSAPVARAEIYGDGTSATYGDLASVVEALNREFVVDSTRFGMDTTGMAAAVAAAVKDYKAVQDTLEHKVDAYPGVIAAKAAFETAFGEYEEADEAYDESVVAFAADKAALIASVKTFRATWDSVANNTGRLSTKDSVVIFNAFKAVMAARKVVFPEEKQWYFYWKLGDKGQAVRDSVEFSEMEFKGLQRNRRDQSTYGGRSNGHGGVTWENAYELSWIFEEAFEGFTEHVDNPSFFASKISHMNQSIERIGSDEALINAISMRDHLYRNLLFGKYFYGQNDAEGKILKYGYFQSEGNEVTEISRIEKAEKHEAKKKGEGRYDEPADYTPYVDTDYEYLRKSVLDAMDVANEAADEANEAWSGIYDARDYFYKNFYCKFWGIRYRELCDSRRIFSEPHARFNDDSDSLRIEFSLETFTEPTPIVSFNFDGTTPYQDGKFIYKGENVDDKRNAIDEDEVIPNIQFVIVDNEVFRRFEDVYSRHHDIGFEFGKTLLAKVLYKQAVLASVHTDGQGTKESLAALKDICVDVVNAYEAALKKQSADSEPFYKFIEGLVGKETLAYIFEGLDKALAKAVEYIPATVQTENDIAWAMYYDVINKIANKELTSKEALIAIFEDFMCGETTLLGSKWIWAPSHFAKWFNRYPSVNELSRMTSTLTQEGPKYQNAQYFKAYVALQLSDAFSGDQFRTILADVVKYYLNAIDVDLAGIDNTLENIIEKVLFGTVRSLNGDFNNIDNVVDFLFALFSDDSDDSEEKGPEQGKDLPAVDTLEVEEATDVVNSVAAVRTSGSDSQGDVKVAESLKLALKAIFVATPTILNHIIADCDGIICQLDKKYFTEWRAEWAAYDTQKAVLDAQYDAYKNELKAYDEYLKGIRTILHIENYLNSSIEECKTQYDADCKTLAAIAAGADGKQTVFEAAKIKLANAQAALAQAEYELERAKAAYDQVLANHKND